MNSSEKIFNVLLIFTIFLTLYSTIVMGNPYVLFGGIVALLFLLGGRRYMFPKRAVAISKTLVDKKQLKLKKIRKEEKYRGKVLFSPWCPECNKYKGRQAECPHCGAKEG